MRRALACTAALLLAALTSSALRPTPGHTLVGHHDPVGYKNFSFDTFSDISSWEYQQDLPEFDENDFGYYWTKIIDFMTNYTSNHGSKKHYFEFYPAKIKFFRGNYTYYKCHVCEKHDTLVKVLYFKRSTDSSHSAGTSRVTLKVKAVNGSTNPAFPNPKPGVFQKLENDVHPDFRRESRSIVATDLPKPNYILHTLADLDQFLGPNVPEYIGYPSDTPLEFVDHTIPNFLEIDMDCAVHVMDETGKTHTVSVKAHYTWDMDTFSKTKKDTYKTELSIRLKRADVDHPKSLVPALEELQRFFQHFQAEVQQW